MRPITCIAIDDEPMALLIIEQFCRRKGSISLTTYSEPSTGVRQIECTNPDLVFLDIQMNSISGLEIAERLPVGCCLIFTTAHAGYALEGFELDAVDFLHKPFSYERFEKAVDKAYRRIETADAVSAVEASGTPLPQTLTIIQEYCNVTIPLDDIVYIEALGNYIKIYRVSNGYILSHTTMKAVLTQLPAHAFLRVHRSFIVAINKIERFTKSSIQLAGRTNSIPVGKKYAEQVYDLLRSSHTNYSSDNFSAV